ncbi:MAG: FAD-dependent oxidoreductase [Oscillospiraceae bacterium]
MSNLYPHVLSPIRVAGHLLKNRIISAPSTIHTASSGEPYPTEKGIRFFEDRAKAGVGLVTCAGVSIGGHMDDGVHCSWNIYKPNHTNMLCDLAERIHLHGAKCTMELIGVFPDGYTVSDGCSIMGSPPIGREIPVEEMEKFRQQYIEAAVAIKKAGFDGILLHFGHSIPIAQFLSPLTNKRKDEYGGSTENRCRYPKSIIDGIRQAVGKDMIIEVRLSGTEFEKGGIDLEEGIRIAEILQENVDIIQASAGMHNPKWMTWTHPCGFLPPTPNAFIAKAFKESGRIKKFVSTIGGFGTLEQAEEVIASGGADFVVAARSFIADIDWVKKCREGRTEDVRPCVKCMRCHDSDNYEQHLQCTVNPVVGMEGPIEKIPSPKKAKKVAVIGGGPAGMQAALTAANRGHDVTLYEKTGELGGKLKFADYVSFKYPLANYKNWMISQVEKAGVKIMLNTEATPDMLSGYDAVIAAVGSTPVIPRIPGVENAKVAIDIYGHENELADDVVIIGGGQVGIETGLHLCKLGKKVTILEMQPELAPDASKTHRDELLNEVEREPNMTVILGGCCMSIQPDGVTFEKDGKQVTIPAGSIVLSVGMRALTDLADSFMGITDGYAQAGDCFKARTVEWANKEGFYAAINL